MEPKRLVIELSEERLHEIDVLMETLELRTRAALFDNALTLLKWAIQERLNGRIIVSADEERGSYKELEMPCFPPKIVSRKKYVPEPEPTPAKVQEKELAPAD